ncbi:MAG: translation initiation factor IF-2 subunit beta [Nanoarchaeota archaeon]|nr:translation initiation factor IF-2 subunit beta [Nanoarchaeota archaeon]
MEYEELLEKAYKEIKPIEGTPSDRFKVPQAQITTEKTKTIISNFTKIAEYLRRDPGHMARTLQKSLATPAKIEGDRLIMQRKIMRITIEEKIKDYINEFVICKECGKPDTELNKEGNFTFKHCLACGAKHSVKAKI